MTMYVPITPRNDHVKKLVEFFGGLKSAPAEIPDNLKFVFLCYTNRCGSNFVAELFASSGKYNLAGEDLNYDTVINNATEHNLKSFQDYFSFLLKRKAKSGVFFLKMALPHLELLNRTGVLEQINPSSKFILIERADKLAQAVSFAIAFDTGKFTSNIKGEKEEAEIEFSASKIEGIVNGLVESYKKFDLFFSRNGIVPINITYEQIAATPIRYLELVNLKLGIKGLQIVPEHVRIEKQAGPLNLQWRKLFLGSTPEPE